MNYESAVYKVVGRYRHEIYQPSWCRGKQGTQAKKREYLCKEDFDKYSPALINRGTVCNRYDIEVYCKFFGEGRWIKLNKGDIT